MYTDTTLTNTSTHTHTSARIQVCCSPVLVSKVWHVSGNSTERLAIAVEHLGVVGILQHKRAGGEGGGRR